MGASIRVVHTGGGVTRAAIGFRAHSGWAVLVAIGGSVSVHTAEGEFFREALRSACESCGLAVAAVREREVLSRSAAALGMSPDEVERQVSAMGKNIGPPWTRDEKLCAMAGWLVAKNFGSK